jgi:Fe-S cluster assembly iron-binding protein IscA
MVTVTAEAAGKLWEELQSEGTNPEMSFRLVQSDSEIGKLQMVMGTPEEGDHVVEHQGAKVLLLDPTVSKMLEGRVINYEHTLQGEGFTISKPAAAP